MWWRASRWQMPWRRGAWSQQQPRLGQRPMGFNRRFLSREERIAALEQYLKDLEGEAQGVRERLAQLRGTTGEAK
ncbi:MAG: hypothetical protein A2Y60_05815 [Chloroflexi bacterium RBG_13_54_9]|nr:MAG: hypothetical protein A2Y60_05815 [Chloroflexi bacterium RBG_13_54_9]